MWKQRKWLFVFLLLTAGIFFFRFPWSHLLEKTVRDFQKKHPSLLKADFDNLELFPVGIRLENLRLNYKRQFLALNSVDISMALSQWLAFKKAWKIKVIHEDSHLVILFWKKKKTLKDNPVPLFVYFIKGRSSSFNLKILSTLFPEVKMGGQAQAYFNYEGSKDRIEEAVADFSLKGQNIHLSQTELKTPMGPLSLPPLQWAGADIISHLKEGELVFKSFRLGEPSDKLIVRMKGSGALAFSYGRWRLNAYDIQLQMDVDKNFKMSLLDLMFAGYKEDKGDFNRYLLRLTGKASQVPQMEKLTEF